MRFLLGSFRALKMWQASLAVTVLLGTFGGTYGAYAAVVATKEDRLTEGQVLVTARRGDLVRQVTTSGSLAYPDRTTVRPKSAVTIAEVRAEVGQEVKEGDILATVDEVTLASFRLAVPQAEQALRKAEEALTEAKTFELVQKQAAAANARVRLKDAEASLAAVKVPPLQQYRKQEEAVAAARLQVQTAEDALAAAKAAPYTVQQLRKQEEAIAAARVQMQTAEDALAALKEPDYTAAELGRQEAVIANAEAQLKVARDALAAAKAPYTQADIAKAELVVTRAEEALRLAEQNLPLTESIQRRIVMPLEETLATRKTEYRQTMWTNHGVLVGLIIEAHIFLPPEQLVLLYPTEPSSRTGDAKVAWNNLIAARDGLESARITQANAITNAKKAIEAAQDTLQAAKDTLTTRKAGADPAVVAAKQVAVDSAEAALEAAKKKLTDMKAPVSKLDIDLKTAQVASARAALDAALETLLEMQAGPDKLTIDLRTAQVVTARAALDAALTTLSTLRPDADPLAVAAGEAQVKVASDAWLRAEGDLVALLTGKGTVDLAVLEANLASAKVSVAAAKERLANAHITAPVSGTVTVVNLSAGQAAGANTAAFEIAHTTSIQLNGSVQEVDILSISEGARAEVKLDALPGRTLMGTVDSISDFAAASQGVVTYPVKITLEPQEGVSLREGLTGTATIVLERQEDLLLVPLQAVRGSFDQPSLLMVRGGKHVSQAVTLGPSDEAYVAVLTGAADGEQIVMDSLRVSTSPLAIRQGQAWQGGGLGGLGGGSFTGGGQQGGGRQQQR